MDLANLVKKAQILEIVYYKGKFNIDYKSKDKVNPLWVNLGRIQIKYRKWANNYIKVLAQKAIEMRIIMLRQEKPKYLKKNWCKKNINSKISRVSKIMFIQDIGFIAISKRLQIIPHL